MVSPAKISPPYFSTGFPYAKDSFLSYAGSAWAVMALLSALTEPDLTRSGLPTAQPDLTRSGLPTAQPDLTRSGLPIVQPDLTTSGLQAWARIALFGKAGELASLLDAGLDPNSKTERGTSLLMMAAADPDKVH